MLAPRYWQNYVKKNRIFYGCLLQRNLVRCLAEMRVRAGGNINRENNKQSAELPYTIPWVFQFLQKDQKQNVKNQARKE